MLPAVDDIPEDHSPNDCFSESEIEWGDCVGPVTSCNVREKMTEDRVPFIMNRSLKSLRTEHMHQCEVKRYLDTHHILYASSLNGMKASDKARAREIRSGMKAGVPDLMIFEARGGYHGLFIEMKRPKGDGLREVQKKFIEDLKARGYCARMCRGAVPAINTVRRYMKLPRKPQLKSKLYA